MNPIIIALGALFALCNAAVLPTEERPSYLYDLMKRDLLERQRRDDDSPQLYGTGGGIGSHQSGTIGYRYPYGAGGQLSYGYHGGYGHDVSADVMVPVWQKTSKYGESTLNVGGGVTQHLGGPTGNELTEKRVGISFVHRW